MSPPLFNIISFETFRAESREWKRFGKILFLAAVLPILLVIPVTEFVSWRTGLSIPPEAAARLQMENPHLRWFGSRDSVSARFKLIRVAQERPDVLIMGASRVCQFRAPMFQPYSFYNLARVSWPMNTYPELFRRLPKDYAPKVIIFGLDFFMFNHRYATDPEMMTGVPDYSPPGWRDHLLRLRDVFDTLFDNPAALRANGHDPVSGLPVIGLAPSIYANGFRPDGSETQNEPDLFGYRDPNRNMLKGNLLNRSPLFYGDKMDPEEMAQFEEFAALARARGITLIAVQMPMFGPMAKYLAKDENFGILRDFRAHIAQGYFERQGVIVFDFLDFTAWGQDPRYFIDAWHPTEVISAAVLYQMLGDPRVQAILPKIDVDDLRQKLLVEVHGDQHVYFYPRD